MKVLVTGSNGFIGKNLIGLLHRDYPDTKVLRFDRDNTYDDLFDYCKEADAVFHLAAVLRPEHIEEFDNNIDLTSRLMSYLKNAGNKCPVMFASSIQADLDNPYGKCKRIEESKFLSYGIDCGVNAFVFRFPNLFGKMSKPNYTSVVATFCYNTVNGYPITINNPSTQVEFAFIETVLEYVIKTVFENDDKKANSINLIDDYYLVGLGELAYYMETLRRKIKPSIQRKDDFYRCLSETYSWYEKNSSSFEV